MLSTPTQTPLMSQASTGLNPGDALHYGAKIRLFVGSRNSPTHHQHNAYVSAYFLDTELPPSLVIQQSFTQQGQDIVQPYADLTQSIYFRIVDPSDPSCTMKKQVFFGDVFKLIPYNNTTGEEIDAVFETIAPTKMSENTFSFSLATQSNFSSPSSSSTPLFGAIPVTSLPPPLNDNDKGVKYGVANINLNIIRGVKGKGKNDVLSPHLIEFAKEKGSSITGGYLTSFTETVTTPRGVPIAMKNITFSIRPANDPILTFEIFGSKNDKNITTTTKPAPSPTNSTTSTSQPQGAPLTSIAVHSLYQHHVVYTGDDITDKTMVLTLRDIGKVTLPLSTLPEPPINSFYNKIAPPTTNTHQEFYEYSDETYKKYTPVESIVRTIQVHGSQVSVNLPVRYTKITAQPPLEPFKKDQINKTFKKVSLPAPNPLLCIIAFAALAYQFFRGFESGLFIDLHADYLNLIRFIGPVLIISFLTLSYPILFTGNKGYSMKFTPEKPYCHYIMQFLPPQDATTNNDLILAFSTPAPFVLQNPSIPFGTSKPQPIITNIIGGNVLGGEKKIIDLKKNRTPDEVQQLLASNKTFQYAKKLHQNRSQITSNSLNLFQILDTIRTSALITDANMGPNCFTFPNTSIHQLEDVLTKSTVNFDNSDINLKSAIKILQANGPTPSIITSIRSFNKNLDYTLGSSHLSVGNNAQVKLYYPFIFSAIRATHNISPSDFIEAWTFGVNNLPAAATGAGRSGALFMRSKCQKFIFKTMSKADMATLHAVIDDYGEYITTNPSMLMRFFGVFRIINNKNEKQYFCVGHNAFYTPPSLHNYKLVAKYDLKGRTPKRDPENRLAEANDGVWKDLQLNRVFCLKDTVRDSVIRNIDGDVQWLQSHDCIDYSLLVGVAENEQLANLYDEVSTASEATKAHVLSMINHNMTTQSIPDNVESHNQVGIPQYVKHTDDGEVFFVAIVDFLARYKNFMKRSAHACKSLRWKDEELSTVNSQFYGDRLNRYVKVVFPPNGAVLVRTTEELEQYFLEEANAIINQNNKTTGTGYPPSSTLSPRNTNATASSEGVISSPTIEFLTPQKPKEKISDPQVLALAELSIKQLPDGATKALEPGARSPGSMIVSRTGASIILVPQGVSQAPKSMREKSTFIATELSKLTSQTNID